MKKVLRRTADFIDYVSDRVGHIFCYIVFVIMSLTTIDVISRYVFNKPLIWAWTINRLLFGIFVLFAGIYAMNQREHIRIEILYDHFSRRLKFIARMIAVACFVLFMGVLVWQSSWMGWNAWTISEKVAGPFRIPLYPFKIMIPILAFVFLLEGIVKLSRREDD